MGAMRPWHWIVVLLVVLLIFGGNKLPELAGSVGKSMKVFKKEVKELQDDDASSAQQPRSSSRSREPTTRSRPSPVRPPLRRTAPSSSDRRAAHHERSGTSAHVTDPVRRGTRSCRACPGSP